jgi:hypothetical protein
MLLLLDLSIAITLPPNGRGCLSLRLGWAGRRLGSDWKGPTAAIVLAALAPGAVAQEISKTHCQAVGENGAPEPLGDREGHGISVTTETCRVEGGAMDSGIVTGQGIWEWDGTNAKMVSVSGVVRKPGAMVAYQLTDGALTLTMADGKVTGFTATASGRWPIATGSAASMAGKTFTVSAKSTSAGQWESDVTADAPSQ